MPQKGQKSLQYLIAKNTTPHAQTQLLFALLQMIPIEYNANVLLPTEASDNCLIQRLVPIREKLKTIAGKIDAENKGCYKTQNSLYPVSNV